MTKLILKNKGRLETNKEKSGANTHRELHRHTHTQAQTRNTRTNPQGSQGAFFTIPGHDCKFRVTPGRDILHMSRIDHWTEQSQLCAAILFRTKMLFSRKQSWRQGYKG